jgi:RNA polymerase sigma-70 factor (ECF subfamily)
METDSNLLNAARTMNKDALVQIFDLYTSPLYNYALHLCGDPFMADQIVGDVFARLLDQLSQGKGPKSNLRAYLFQATYHLVVDEARHSQRRVPLDVISSLRDDSHFTSRSMEDNILLETVLHAIQNDLSDDQRHVMVLRFLEEFSLLETAAILGKGVDHVKVIQTRAISKLRRLLNDQEVLKNVSYPRMQMEKLSKVVRV